MKKITLLLACLFGLSLSARAQSTVVVGQGIMPSGSTLPTTCAPTKASDPDSLVLFYHTTSSGGAIGLYQCTAPNTWTAAGGGGGGVTSLTGDGTVITNSASTGAVTLTIAGTSGGIPYFNSTSGWSSSGLLAANALVVGGGAGTTPTTGNGDFTYATHTLTMASTGLLNLSAGAIYDSFRVPNIAGCTGTSNNGDICYNTTDGNMHQKISSTDTIIMDMTNANFVTTNKIPKNTSATVSSFAPSSITDSGTNVLTSEPIGTTDGSFGSNLTFSATACETAFGTTTLATGTTTTSTGQNCLPANSIIEGVVARVTTTITGSCTGWELGDGTTAARFTTNNTNLTSGSTAVPLSGSAWTTGIASATTGMYQQSAHAIVVTCAGGNPGAGAIRIIVYSHSFTNPTS